MSVKSIVITILIVLGVVFLFNRAVGAVSWMDKINNVCGPVNVYGVSATYKAKYCAVYAYPTGSYWVKFCGKYPDYCATL